VICVYWEYACTYKSDNNSNGKVKVKATPLPEGQAKLRGARAACQPLVSVSSFESGLFVWTTNNSWFGFAAQNCAVACLAFAYLSVKKVT
jgi:hypothetical protein